MFQPLVKFKSHLYYEEKDHVTEVEKRLKLAQGAKVGHFVYKTCSVIHLILVLYLTETVKKSEVLDKNSQ